MWSDLQDTTGNWSQNTKLVIPKLKAGTLDSLMTLSDEMVKQDHLVEATVRKLERQMAEFGESEFTVQVERRTVSTADFVADFKWASNKYQEKHSLAEMSTKLYQEVMKVEEELRGKQVEYNAVKSALQSQERKQKGTLAVRSLATLGLESSLFHDTENLVTALVVVPKVDEKLWLSTYATGFLQKDNLEFFPVLLNSSQKVCEDENDDMWTVTLLKRKLQDFKASVREKQPKWTVRDYQFDAQAVAKEKQDVENMQQQESRTRKNLISWCKAQYGEVFRAYVHLKVIRLFVESCLRFGVPPDFQPVVMKPNLKYEKSIRDALQRQFAYLGNQALYAATDDVVGNIGPQEFYPYVFMSLVVTVTTAK